MGDAWPTSKDLVRRTSGETHWLARRDGSAEDTRARGRLTIFLARCAFGKGRWRGDATELETLARAKDGDLVVIPARRSRRQALHRLLGERAREARENGSADRPHAIFTQDALAPMRMASGFSFVRDSSGLLGDDFFAR